ncbi:MAG: glycoside hydrolase family 38 C-terminal domain-containing protein [Thermoguttaceae bacterium]
MNPKSSFSRRNFLQTGLIGGAGAALLGPGLLSGVAFAGDAPESFCVALCNHWSYIGIGWQLGIESCVLSVTDAMELFDRAHVKTCINLDARAYEFMAEKFPEVAAKLKKYLAAGKVELIAGTYAQPMGTTIGSESNIRQMVVGRATVRKALGYDVLTFLEEEEFTHPQVPQLATLAGYRYASLAQLDTWGRAGCPVQNLNAFHWQGMDGTAIPCVPKNALFGVSADVNQLAASPEFKKLKALGKPLVFTWEEFGWDNPEQPAYLTAPARFQALASKANVEFVTIREYLQKYGGQGKETIYLPMDAWDKSLTWGLGGDQVRIFDRKVESLLLAAEIFDAAASSLGAASQCDLLDKAWRNELSSQSHDVGLCESSRWQGDLMAPADRIEDHHNFTWGAIGYNHLDAAQKQGQQVLDASLAHVAKQVGSASQAHGPLAATVFNPHGWTRTGLATTGRIYPLPGDTKDVVVKDSSGNTLPSQIVKSEKDAQGNLIVANVAFPAKEAPSAGYDTYYVDFAQQPAASAKTDLQIDETKLTLENEHLRVRLDPTTGGIASLVYKAAGSEMLDAGQGACPRLTGKPNPNLSLRPNPPAFYDTAKSKAAIDWLAKGPLYGEVRAQHALPYLRFETRIRLDAGSPYVELYTRMFASLPPHSDAWPANIKEGYWMSFLPAFHVTSVLRDFPFGIEPTKHSNFHALTFVDLLGKDTGLLVVHPGTQYFRREEKGAVGNLLMREWESHFTREYGWPLYVEYHHALQPHDGKFDNSDRLRAAKAFIRPLLTHVAPPQQGNQPTAKSFAAVTPAGVQLSALRRKPNNRLEVRVVEVEGRGAKADVTLGFPVAGACETNLVGDKIADAAHEDNQLRLSVDPWKIRTFEIES